MEAGWRADGFLPCHVQGQMRMVGGTDMSGKIAYALAPKFVEVRINKWTREIRLRFRQAAAVYTLDLRLRGGAEAVFFEV